jgi:hypothetical protein
MLLAAREKEDAHRRTMEDLNKPLPPLDGNTLGRELLNNLGLTRTGVPDPSPHIPCASRNQHVQCGLECS